MRKLTKILLSAMLFFGIGTAFADGDTEPTPETYTPTAPTFNPDGGSIALNAVIELTMTDSRPDVVKYPRQWVCYDTNLTAEKLASLTVDTLINKAIAAGKIKQYSIAAKPKLADWNVQEGDKLTLGAAVVWIDTQRNAKWSAITAKEFTATAAASDVPSPTLSPASGTVKQGQKITLTFPESLKIGDDYLLDAIYALYTEDDNVTLTTSASDIYSHVHPDIQMPLPYGVAMYREGDDGTLEANLPVRISQDVLGSITLHVRLAVITLDDVTYSDIVTADYTVEEAAEIPVPTFNPAQGEVDPGTKVTITAADANEIWYVIDGSDEDLTLEGFNTDKCKEYKNPIEIYKGQTIKAIAVQGEQPPFMYSQVATATYTVKGGDVERTDIPKLTPNPTTAMIKNGVATFSCTMDPQQYTHETNKLGFGVSVKNGADIENLEFRTDVDAEWTAYNGAGLSTLRSQQSYLAAIPNDKGVSSNRVVAIAGVQTVYYRLTLKAGATRVPEFTFATVELTKSGIWSPSEPTFLSTATLQFEIFKPDTLPMPEFSVEAGEVVKGTTVTLSCDTADAKIYYSINADTVTENSLEYTAAIAIDSNMSIRAIAVLEDFVNSPVAVAAYTVKEEPIVEEKDTLPMPKFSLVAGEVTKGITVTLSCDTADAKIYYSVNADTVTVNSLEYTAAIAIDSNMSIRAIAVKEGFENSPVAVAAYTVKEEETANEGAELAGVRVYPNPNAGTFSVDVPERARVEIFGLNGAMLMSREVNAGVAAFNLDHSGIYFVRVTANNKTAVKRVIVR